MTIFDDDDDDGEREVGITDFADDDGDDDDGDDDKGCCKADMS